MISRIRTSSALAFILTSILLSSLSLSGCNSATALDLGPELAHGHYFVQSDEDGTYHYDQYFVVQDDNRFEFVEYGYELGQPDNLCQVTRQAGMYRLGDTLLTVTQTAIGESVEGCHMTKEQFQSYPFTSIPAAKRSIDGFPIRNVPANGFEGKDLFVGTTGWKTYVQKPDPYGFY